jgi:hypothetical protein
VDEELQRFVFVEIEAEIEFVQVFWRAETQLRACCSPDLFRLGVLRLEPRGREPELP